MLHLTQGGRLLFNKLTKLKKLSTFLSYFK
ncbi:hypothetical protein TorRG33x02_242300 [Trema orientale]|uniref:Uncharacterized protein n=1 Tax=Trema orientale TaxID=63057 RepID=A0A2P5DTB4_TREOI|nr:hypothetical protein TorRG33x02_242300 [Trema orientale]